MLSSHAVLLSPFVKHVRFVRVGVTHLCAILSHIHASDALAQEEAEFDNSNSAQVLEGSAVLQVLSFGFQ